MKTLQASLVAVAARVRLAICHTHLDVEIVPPSEGRTKSGAYLAKTRV